MTTTTSPLLELLATPLGPNGTIDGLAEQLLARVATETAVELSLNFDDLTDRQSQRLIRPLLACLARMSATENGTEFTPYGGALAFTRTGLAGVVRIVGEFENRPGAVRLAFRRPIPVVPIETTV